MAHEYAVKIHNYISSKIATVEKMIIVAEKNNDLETRAFYRGQLDELMFLRNHLTQRTDLNTQQYY